MSQGRVHVAVSGGGDAGDDVCRLAEEVGRELARHGAVVVTGGLGGVMAAASRGAKEAGGATVGILPGDDRAGANPWVDVALPTGMGEGRNVLLVRASDAVVAVAGGYGTLSEIALALRMGKPVVGLVGPGTWDVDAIVKAGTPADAAERAVALARARLGRPRGS